MDFYSFKNHMQKLVVIDFPHHTIITILMILIINFPSHLENFENLYVFSSFLPFTLKFNNDIAFMTLTELKE